MNAGNAKQCDLKELVTVMQFAQEAETVGDRAIYSRVPGCCERKWAADRAVTDHGGLTVEIRNRWTENFPDENVLPPTARVSAEVRDENQ